MSKLKTAIRNLNWGFRFKTTLREKEIRIGVSDSKPSCLKNIKLLTPSSVHFVVERVCPDCGFCFGGVLLHLKIDLYARAVSIVSSIPHLKEIVPKDCFQNFKLIAAFDKRSIGKDGGRNEHRAAKSPPQPNPLKLRRVPTHPALDLLDFPVEKMSSSNQFSDFDFIIFKFCFQK